MPCSEAPKPSLVLAFKLGCSSLYSYITNWQLFGPCKSSVSHTSRTKPNPSGMVFMGEGWDKPLWTLSGDNPAPCELQQDRRPRGHIPQACFLKSKRLIHLLSHLRNRINDFHCEDKCWSSSSFSAVLLLCEKPHDTDYSGIIVPLHPVLFPHLFLPILAPLQKTLPLPLSLWLNINVWNFLFHVTSSLSVASLVFDPHLFCLSYVFCYE